MILQIELNQDMENRLNQLAQKTGRSRTECARMALEEWLEEWEDIRIAHERLKKGNPTIPFEALEKELDYLSIKNLT